MNIIRADNDEIAAHLDEVADILEFKGANPFRVMSYRRAASRIRDFEEPIYKLFARRGARGLRCIDGIGDRLSGSIAEILETGRLGMLTRLRAELSPADVFATLPGLGPQLAGRIVDHLDIDSLEELERAVHDGRLEKVPGIGPRKVEGIGHALAGMLNRGARRRAQRRIEDLPEDSEKPPSVGLLLALDAEYRRRARAGSLPTVAPHRFNPDKKRWLPLMETDYGPRHFTVLFSNTRRAHQLGRNHDWVVIYVDDGDGPQYTVVTATSGALRDKRVVRGRERECRQYYERRRPTPGGRRF